MMITMMTIIDCKHGLLAPHPSPEPSIWWWLRLRLQCWRWQWFLSLQRWRKLQDLDCILEKSKHQLFSCQTMSMMIMMMLMTMVMMMTTTMTTPQMPKDQLDFCPSLSNFVEGPGLCKLVASLLFCRPSPKPEDDRHFGNNHDDDWYYDDHRAQGWAIRFEKTICERIKTLTIQSNEKE